MRRRVTANNSITAGRATWVSAENTNVNRTDKAKAIGYALGTAICLMIVIVIVAAAFTGYFD